MNGTREIEHLAEIAGDFDAVALDQFGVLHDGSHPFPGAAECLARLHERGVPMVALTNSGKRSQHNLERLQRLGFPREWFRALTSSGELTRDLLGRMLADGRLSPGSRVLVLSRDGDRGMIEGLPLRASSDDESVALVLIGGVEPERLSRDDYARLLRAHALDGVPAICAAPDRVIYAGGRPGFGPGVVADDYARAGGTVTMLGKPARPIFDKALELLGDPEAGRVLMIGDSVEHDVQGGRKAGMKTLFIASGVQSGAGERDAADYAMTALRW